jgi:cation transport regulator ChaB
MPYRVNADLPSSAPGHPAEPAQEIFREAIGAARAGGKPPHVDRRHPGLLKDILD